MQRIIKFRGKRKDNGQWVYGFAVQDYFTDKWFVATTGDPILSHIDLIEVDPNTVGQFTGLKDKNGKEIYEGDIVVFVEYEKYQGKITYRIGGFNFEGKNGNTVLQALNPLDCKIIGNIHDNPELLESVRE